MADFGEYLPTDAVLFGGRSAEEAHNDFPRLWAEVNRRAVGGVADGADEVVFFMRAGFVGSSGSARLFWLGDQLTTWDGFDGMRSALVGVLTSGLTGSTLTHSDLGGYTAMELVIEGQGYSYCRSKELLLRWMEMSAFSDAVFR
jgi:alpha-glucosidase